MNNRVLLFGVVGGLAVAVWIVAAGGPARSLADTWVYGLRCLVAGVIVAEIIVRLTRRR